MIRIILSKRKLYLITAFFITILSLTIIHNFSYYDQSPYSFNTLLDYLPSFLKIIFLIKGYNMDFFPAFFNYFFKWMSLLLILYAFFKGKQVGKNQSKSEFSLLFLRVKRKQLFKIFFLEFNLEIIIIIIPLLIFSHIGLYIDVGDYYLFTFTQVMLLYLIALSFYFFAIFLYQISQNKRKIFIITFTILTVIFSYLSVVFNKQYFSLFSILEIYQLEGLLKVIAYGLGLVINLILGFLTLKKYLNTDIDY